MLAIEHGRVIDPANQRDEVTNLYVHQGKIAAIGSTPPSGAVISQRLDASHQVVAPGFIDLCAHMREPGFSQKGTIASESRAAIAAGITTLVCPPTTKPVVDNPAVAEMIADRARAAGQATILPMGALTQGLEGQQLAPMHALHSSGCIAFSNARQPVNSSLVLLRCLEYASTHDLLVIFQPQEASLVTGGCMHDDTTSTRLGLNGIPETAETIEVARSLLLVEQTGVRAHFGQLSCERSVRMIMEARQRGLKVSADVAVHQLLLTDENVNGFNSLFHLIPPLRSQLDRAGLLHALLNDGIQAICSDHQPHDPAAKQAPFAATEPGISALETLLPLGLLLVEQELLSLPQLVEKITLSPAQILGLKQGTLSPGNVADICIFDPAASWQLNADTMYSQGKNTPFLDMPLKGRVTHTLAGGELLFQLT